jgi:hypothetical protein
MLDTPSPRTDTPLDAMVDALLWEGYSLYPYTPGATKNATPTPFGIIYPAVYAAECAGAFDHQRLECLATLEPEHATPELSVELRWLEQTGEGQEGTARSVALGPVAIGSRETLAFDRGRLTVRSEPAEDGEHTYVRVCVHNSVEAEPGLDRPAALRQSLISTHIVLRIAGGKFVSPLEAGLRSINTFPVLASAADDVIIGAAIALPDHPQLAPESLGSLFDGTEIEEALQLHIQVLTDEERADIEAGDPKVAEMIARAGANTPDDLLALHGRVTMRDPREGEPQVTIAGTTYHRGDTVILRPRPEADLHARMVAGRRATIERLLIEFDGRVHFGVTIDGEPGQDILRETARFLYFFEDEVEVV